MTIRRHEWHQSLMEINGYQPESAGMRSWNATKPILTEHVEFFECQGSIQCPGSPTVRWPVFNGRPYSVFPGLSKTLQLELGL